MPSLSLEVATGSRTTLSAEVTGSMNAWGHRFRTVGVAPEYRWWLGGSTFDRFFLGVGAKVMHYDFDWKGENRKGDTGGLGITFGYDFFLGRHFAVDLSAGVGAMAFWQNHTYDAASAGKAKTEREHGINIIPYQVGVSLVYIIK